jgi:hypothetical protein
MYVVTIFLLGLFSNDFNYTLEFFFLEVFHYILQCKKADIARIKYFYFTRFLVAP